MKKILTTLLLATVFLGCTDSYGDNYQYNWIVKATYTNGDVDTLEFSAISFKGNECSLYLKVSENGLLSSGGTTPCLFVKCGFREGAIVCGVRNYDVLSLNKIPIK